MTTPDQVIAKIREALEGDHDRLCQGREYTCTCGHDDAVQQALSAALQSAADTPAPATHLERHPYEPTDNGCRICGRGVNFDAHTAPQPREAHLPPSKVREE